MTKKELTSLINHLKFTFEIVRIVDVRQNIVYSFEDEKLIQTDGLCYDVWNKKSRCENCISAKCLESKKKMTKFEFIEKDVYLVVSRYITLDSNEYILEAVVKVDNEALAQAGLKDEISNQINEYNHKLYVDPLTGCYNSNYLDEQILNLADESYSIALIDIDNFSKVLEKDKDDILLKVTSCIKKEIISKDMPIKLEGDRFIVVLPESLMYKEKHKKILENINNITLSNGKPLTACIGIISQIKNKDDVYNDLEMLMYEAKKVRNRIIIK